MLNLNSGPSSILSGTAPAWELPYQQYGLQQALAQFQGINSPQQLVAGFSPQQNQAISGITDLATNGTPETSAAQSYVSNVLSGQPANNPYLNSEFNLGANAVQNRLESEFAGSGRNVIGSLPIQSDELNNLATQLYGGAYQTGIQQQENALGQAVPLEQEQFGAQQNLYNAGGAIQNLGQEFIQAPQTFLSNYLGQVGMYPGTQSTLTQPLSGAQQIGQASALAGLGGTAGSQIGNYIGGLLGSSGSTASNVGGILGSLAGAFA